MHLKINSRPQICVFIRKNVLEVAEKKTNSLPYVPPGRCGETTTRAYLKVTVLVFLETALK